MSTTPKTTSSYSSTNSSSSPPPPPPDLGTYTRSMHQHTKRQMESMAQSPPPVPPARSAQRRPPSPTGLPEAALHRGRDVEEMGMRKRSS